MNFLTDVKNRVMRPTGKGDELTLVEENKALRDRVAALEKENSQMLDLKKNVEVNK